jgi:hypothetical protein
MSNKTLLSFLSFFILTIAWFTMPGCNNKAGKETTKEDSVTKKDEKLAALTECTISSYTLTVAQQEKIFDITNYNRIRRIVLRFTKSPDCPAELVACGNDENKFCLTNPVTLTAIPGSGKVFKVDLKNHIKDQLASRGDFKILYSINTVGQVVPMPDGTFQDLTITPAQDPVTHDIYFIINTPGFNIQFKKIKVAGQIYTNPSPPREACVEGLCDDPS